MICKNCGRPLNKKICDYCGTDYRTDLEKREAEECDHFYDAVICEEDIRKCQNYLVFKCYRCGKETRMSISQRLTRNLTRGYLL